MKILNMIENKYLCNCKKYNLFEKDYIYWEDRKTTSDELDVIKFIKKEFIIENKNLLHIGIGNSEIASIFNEAKKIVGITVSKGEFNFANKLNLNNYEIFLCDKYSENFVDITHKFKFDFIIDTNLKSYSCCSKSFNYMFTNYLKILNLDGKIITSRKGMNWYKQLKPKLSFSLKKLFHYKLKEIEGDKSNILSLDEINKISADNNLKLTYNERVLYLAK